MIIVLISTGLRQDVWHVLRHATPGDRIATLCAWALPYLAVDVLTVDLADYDSCMPDTLCPACRTELAARTPGAAVCVEPVQPRAVTKDMRGSRRSTVELDDLAVPIDAREPDEAWGEWLQGAKQ
jgi:hypothetical protein